jgi:hypothetical protein
MASTQPVRVPERQPETTEVPASASRTHEVPARRKPSFTIKVRGMIPT